MIQIFAFGDSITKGPSRYPGTGWVEKLESFLDKKKYKVYNFGVCGEKSSDLLERFDIQTEKVNEGDIIPVRINSKNKRKVVYDFERGDLDIK